MKHTKAMYPVFVDLEGKRCLVVGGGGVAERKIAGLLECGANVVVVAPEITATVAALADDGTIELHRRVYVEGEAAGYFIVIASTGNRPVNRMVSRDAGASGRLVNVADTPELCSFFVPSVLRRGDLRIAVSTGGASPALARRIRRDLEESYPPAYEKLLDRLRELRRSLMEREPDAEKRRSILIDVARSPEITRFLEGDGEPLETILKKWI